jgi:hypothetical protein
MHRAVERERHEALTRSNSQPMQGGEQVQVQ